MLDPVYLIVLDERTEVFEDGYGIQEANRVAVTDYYSGAVMVPDPDVPAIKGHGANGDVYVPEDAVDYIVDLTDHEFRPV